MITTSKSFIDDVIYYLNNGYELRDDGMGWLLRKRYNLWRNGDKSIEVPKSVVFELLDNNKITVKCNVDGCSIASLIY